MQQQTLAEAFSLAGSGIHTGVPARITVHPAEPGHGRVFVVGGVTIPARADFVVDTARCTTLGRDGRTVRTVEHLLAALAGCGVDNARIVMEGPEVPILDGSAAPFVEAILAVGLREQGALARVLTLLEPVRCERGNSLIEACPNETFDLEVATEFADWPAGTAVQRLRLDPRTNAFREEVAPARTFAFRKEVDLLLAAGLARGGSLENALVITPPDVFSSPLRVPREWCAHKMLDMIGDLALVDARLQLSIRAVKPGHPINTLFANAVLTRIQ